MGVVVCEIGWERMGRGGGKIFESRFELGQINEWMNGVGTFAWIERLRWVPCRE